MPRPKNRIARTQGSIRQVWLQSEKAGREIRGLHVTSRDSQNLQDTNTPTSFQLNGEASFLNIQPSIWANLAWKDSATLMQLGNIRIHINTGCLSQGFSLIWVTLRLSFGLNKIIKTLALNILRDHQNWLTIRTKRQCDDSSSWRMHQLSMSSH